MPRRTVARIIRRKKETGLNTERPRSGRPPTFSRAEKTRIVRTARKNPRLSLQAVAVEAGLETSTFTVRTTLAAKGIHSRIARRRPGLKPEHKRERLEFAKKILEFSDISRIVFSDETSIVRGNGSGQVRVLRRKEEEYHPDFITPTTKSRCVVMVWGAIALGKKSEIIPMVRDETSAKKGFTAKSYVDVLDKGLIPLKDQFEEDCVFVGEEFGDSAMVFQQDNASIHSAGVANDFFKMHNIPLLKWPAMSPDLNPIEHLWSLMKRELRKKLPYRAGASKACREETQAGVEEVWSCIPQETIDNLILSLPKRARAVIKARGGHIKY